MRKAGVTRELAWKEDMLDRRNSRDRWAVLLYHMAGAHSNPRSGALDGMEFVGIRV
jgi:hypothetical protein